MAGDLGYPENCVLYFVLEDPNKLAGSFWPQIDAYAGAVKQHSKRPIGGYGSQAYIEHAHRCRPDHQGLAGGGLVDGRLDEVPPAAALRRPGAHHHGRQPSTTTSL